MFAFLSGVTRSIHGIGVAFSSTLVLTIAASLSEEDQVSTTLGYIELSYSSGLAIGPIVGSMTYFYFGYYFPFFFVGFCMISCIYFVGNLEISEEVQ